MPLQSQKRIAMIVYSAYESDNRVMRYAEALVRRGDHVDVFGIGRDDSRPSREVINQVNFYRLQNRIKNEKAKLSYFLRIFRFFVISAVVLTWKHLRRSYDVVHVHNIPDFLVFAALLPRLTGSRIILDIHDIVPEFFSSKFETSADSLYISILKRIERYSCSFAHHVIVSNHLWMDKVSKRSASPDKCSVFINYVDMRVFTPRPRTRKDARCIAIFPGGLHWHQGLDVAIRAFRLVVRSLPNAEFHIYGEGSMKAELVRLVNELGLRDTVRFFSPVPLQDIPQIIANADVGLVPKRADSFGNEAFSTKIMEFMSQRVPVLAAETKIDLFYFSERTVCFFESGNESALAAKLVHLFLDQEYRKALVMAATEFLDEYNWDVQSARYLAVVDGNSYEGAKCVTSSINLLTSAEHPLPSNRKD
jgi:glycosyltransferase involved in cell wall biosynthesis